MLLLKPASLSQLLGHVGLLPRETFAFSSEVPVVSGIGVDRATKLQMFDNALGREVKQVENRLFDDTFIDNGGAFLSLSSLPSRAQMDEHLKSQATHRLGATLRRWREMQLQRGWRTWVSTTFKSKVCARPCVCL